MIEWTTAERIWLLPINRDLTKSQQVGTSDTLSW